MLIRIWEKSIEDQRLRDILKSFNCNDDAVEICTESTYEPGADVDIFLGSWKKNRDAEHHKLKCEIVDKAKNFIVLETPLLERQAVQEVMPDEWFRVGLGGFMRDAKFAPLNNQRKSNDTRCNPTYPRSIHGDYILVVLQLPGDASLDGIDINQWAESKVEEIRKLTDRDIVLRLPQLKREFNLEFAKKYPHMYVQQGTHKDKQITLNNAYAVVTYSSGMGVEGIINGNRTYIESKNGFYSKTPEDGASLPDVLGNEYQNFNSLNHQEQYIDFLKSTQWYKNEIADGSCWNEMRKLINNA